MKYGHVVAGVLTLALAGCRPPAGGPAAGSAAPVEKAVAGKFSIPSLTEKGAAIALESFGGKVVLLDFWATWCPPCKAELPALDRLAGELQDKGFVLIGMNVDQGSWEEVAEAAARFKLNYPLGLAGPEVQAAYGGIRAVPTKFLLDRQGKVRKSYVGIVAEAELRSDIETLLAE